MARILLLETSTSNCSVSLAHDGRVVYTIEQAEQNYVHAEKLHVFITSVLQKSGIQAPELDAIAVSSGPGSYTGLRIGVSAAKGLCFALQKPLIVVDTLTALAGHAIQLVPEGEMFIPMIDARRMEVYLAMFNNQLDKMTDTSAVVLNEDFFESISDRHIVLCGDGASKCRHMITGRYDLIDNLPSAAMMATIAEDKFNHSKFEDVAYFEPFYLKEYLPGIAKKQA